MNPRNINHLLILTPGFPANEQETTCLPAVQQIVLAYQKYFPNTRISIISLHYPFASGSYQWNNIHVYAIGGRNRTGVFTPLLIAKTIRKGLSVHKRNKVDAILCLWLRDTALAGKIIANHIGIPYLIWMLGQDAKKGNKYITRLRAKGNELIVMSGWQRDVLYESYNIIPYAIVNNGINENIFPVFNDGSRSIDILAVGSLIPLKQYHLFIDIIKFIKDNGYPRINAMLCGEGILESELKEQISRLGLENNIQLTGSIDHSLVLGHMNNAKIFLHPSLYEGNSTVMLEALYSGCKVIAFIPPGEKKSQNFWLCKDMDEMKHKCLSLLQHPQHYSRENYSSLKDCVELLHNILLEKKTAYENIS